MTFQHNKMLINSSDLKRFNSSYYDDEAREFARMLGEFVNSEDDIHQIAVVTYYNRVFDPANDGRPQRLSQETLSYNDSKSAIELIEETHGCIPEGCAFITLQVWERDMYLALFMEV
jgi:hypothetical protein